MLPRLPARALGQGASRQTSEAEEPRAIHCRAVALALAVACGKQLPPQYGPLPAGGGTTFQPHDHAPWLQRPARRVPEDHRRELPVTCVAAQIPTSPEGTRRVNSTEHESNDPRRSSWASFCARSSGMAGEVGRAPESQSMFCTDSNPKERFLRSMRG